MKREAQVKRRKEKERKENEHVWHAEENMNLEKKRKCNDTEAEWKQFINVLIVISALVKRKIVF